MLGVGGSSLTLGIVDEVGAGATEEGRAKGRDVESALTATGIAGAVEESPAGTISCTCIAVSTYDLGAGGVMGSTTCMPASAYDLSAGGSASTSMTSAVEATTMVSDFES